MADLLSRITVNYTICHGQPTVRGLRYLVHHILELLASGMTDAEILADYEDLEVEDLRACQAYAAMLLKKIGKTLSMNGLTEEQIAAGQFRQPLTKQEFLAHLQATRQASPDTTVK